MVQGELTMKKAMYFLLFGGRRKQRKLKEAIQQRLIVDYDTRPLAHLKECERKLKLKPRIRYKLRTRYILVFSSQGRKRQVVWQ
jgi:hypothetical protein